MLYQQGDLADEHGRTITNGGVPLELFHCALCPVRIMPEPDELTQKAQEVYAYMASNPFPEHAPDMEFIFKMVGLRVGSDESKAVYERVLTRIQLEREHREKREGKPGTNGHPGRQDLGSAGS